MAAAEAMAMLSSREVSEAFLRQDDGNRLVGISIAFIILTTIFIGLRLFSRRFTVAPLGLDDFFILAAYVVDLGMCAICIGEFLTSVHPPSPHLIPASLLPVRASRILTICLCQFLSSWVA